MFDERDVATPHAGWSQSSEREMLRLGYGSGRASYDLRRLRLRGLVERLPRSHRYRVTEAGQRVALCYCRGQRRVLAPAHSALFDDKAPPALGRLVARFEPTVQVESWTQRP